MVAQKKEISKCLFLFLCYYNIIILQYYTIYYLRVAYPKYVFRIWLHTTILYTTYVLLIPSMFSGYGCVVLYAVCERLSP